MFYFMLRVSRCNLKHSSENFSSYLHRIVEPVILGLYILYPIHRWSGVIIAPGTHKPWYIGSSDNISPSVTIVHLMGIGGMERCHPRLRATNYINHELR